MCSRVAKGKGQRIGGLRRTRDTSRENGGQIRVTDTRDLSGNVLFKREAGRGSRKERMPLK